MKKLFLLAAIPMLTLIGCRADPKPPLPDYTGTEIKLTPENSTLTEDASTSATVVELEIPNSNETYSVEISSGCRWKTTSGGYKEILLSPGSYIKSISTLTVARLQMDIFGRQGINYDVYANNQFQGDPLEEHLTNIPATEPNDYGQVFEYAVHANGWSIKNNTEYNKPCFYYITIIL